MSVNQNGKYERWALIAKIKCIQDVSGLNILEIAPILAWTANKSVPDHLGMPPGATVSSHWLWKFVCLMLITGVRESYLCNTATPLTVVRHLK